MMASICLSVDLIHRCIYIVLLVIIGPFLYMSKGPKSLNTKAIYSRDEEHEQEPQRSREKLRHEEDENRA